MVPLQQEIQAEEHYTNARQAFERNDWATAEQLCATALAIFPTHTASLELQGNARNAGAADRAIQSGRGLMGSRQFVEAGQALAEAARLLEPIRAKQHMLADCYFDMGVSPHASTTSNAFEWVLTHNRCGAGGRSCGVPPAGPTRAVPRAADGAGRG